MKFIWNVFLLPLLLTKISSKNVNLLSQFSESNARFATNLYSAIIADQADENIIVSPFSVQICGSLLYSGAAGTTAEEIVKGLNLFENDRFAVASAIKEVLTNHTSEYLQLANKIYLREGVQVKEDFYKTARNEYFSDEETIDFSKGEEAAEIINNWVQNATHNRIKNLFKKSDFNERNVMALVNTIYFKEKWLIPFEFTWIKPFWISENDTKDVEMMYRSDEEMKFTEVNELDAAAVQLDYNNTDMSMLIILPNKRSGLKKLEEKLSEIDLINLQNKMRIEYVNLFLPKFHIDLSVNLKDTFQKMGMESIFEEGADFSNMVENRLIKVDKAVHKAFIDVTEIGTEAGAATGSSGHDYTIPRRFIADHPFFFAIVSKTVVLFLGRYAK